MIKKRNDLEASAFLLDMAGLSGADSPTSPPVVARGLVALASASTSSRSLSSQAEGDDSGQDKKHGTAVEGGCVAALDAAGYVTLYSVACPWEESGDEEPRYIIDRGQGLHWLREDSRLAFSRCLL